jgi:hypothetical protein
MEDLCWVWHQPSLLGSFGLAGRPAPSYKATELARRSLLAKTVRINGALPSLRAKAMQVAAFSLEPAIRHSADRPSPFGDLGKPLRPSKQIALHTVASELA